MRTKFTTTLGSKSAATSVLVSAELQDGRSGLGEVPTSFVLPHETVAAIVGILRHAADELRGTPIEDYPQHLAAIRRRFPDFHMTLSGLETAVFRANLAARAEDEHRHWGGRRQSIQTDITIPFLPDVEMLDHWLGKCIRAGFTIYKIKVTGDVAADLAFVARIRAVLAQAMPRFTIRLDGNQGYTPRTYERMLRGLGRAGLAVELFEQPLHKDDRAGLRKIRGLAGVPVILDETVFSCDACRRVIDDRLGDGVNIKIAKSGLAEAAKIHAMARLAGLKLMIGCMTETMTALSAGILFAAGKGGFDYIDLDSVHLLHHRRRYGGIEIRRDCYDIY